MKTLVLALLTSPLLAFLLLFIFSQQLSQKWIKAIGVLGMLGSSIASLSLALVFNSLELKSSTVHFWSILPILSANVAFLIDALSLVMAMMLSFISLLIAIFSLQFMEDEEGIPRYFAIMNLFVLMMLVLVLSDNMLLLYLGWEGVGLCSYLLIGHFHEKIQAGLFSMKAFLMTRLGDMSLLIGIIIAALSLGTLNISEVSRLSSLNWAIGSNIATLVAICFLIGGISKSAQLPLHTWLPDAMVGPTPVSALIHAATMVTAGVYLIARNYMLFELSPLTKSLILVIGLSTALFAALCAFAQRDLKRVLAYSTISQIGYMFLSLGVGAYSAAIFHLITHAFFKALLFLSAGAIGYSMHHQYDMTKLGGLSKSLPIIFWTFLIGSASLAGLPLISAGFYSKEWILSSAFAYKDGGLFIFVLALSASLLTAIYIFRAFFMTFLGQAKTNKAHEPGLKMYVPLLVLAFFSLIIGFLETPSLLGHQSSFSSYLSEALPKNIITLAHSTELILLISASLLSLLGIYLAYLFYKNNAQEKTKLSYLEHGFMLDNLYQKLFTEPYLALSKKISFDPFAALSDAISQVFFRINQYLNRLHSAFVGHYLLVMGLSIAVLMGMMVFKK